MSCSAIVASGKNKGQLCGKKVKANDRCGIHSKKTPAAVTNVVRNDLPFSGEELCSVVLSSGKRKGEKCDRKAYFFSNEEAMCGTHSSVTTRTKLKKRPEDPNRWIEHAKSVAEARERNAAENKKGELLLFRMKMMSAIDTKEGYLNVFPNCKHGARKDGLGLPALSPMNLGPVDHGQPNLPKAVTIEGFHQYSKCFKEEADDGNPSEVFVKNRLEGYLTEEPKRHKFTSKDIPLFFVWRPQRSWSEDSASKTSTHDMEEGEEHLDYIQSRQFYCNFYERLAKETKEFKELKELLENGTNIQLCGYDAYPMDNVESAYLNPVHPFGHERMLYSMLTLEEDYPWRKYKTFEF
jgi:hypothetical protein